MILLYLKKNVKFFSKLSKVIDDMGCKSIFDSKRANFDDMIHRDRNDMDSLFINKFITKSCIDMFDPRWCKQQDEDKVKATSNMDTKTLEFICNKPFLFVVHDNVFENILFIGRYVKPSK